MSSKRKFIFKSQTPFAKKARTAMFIAGKMPVRAMAAAISAKRSSARMRMRNRVTAGFLGIETKFYDTSRTSGSVTAPTDATGGEFDPSATSMISTPAQGDGEQNRDGKKIVILNCYVKGNVNTTAAANQTTVPPRRRVFVALVQDTQSNGAQMNSEDCFKNLAGGSNSGNCVLRNLLYAQRFKVIKTFEAELTPPTMSYDGTNMESSGSMVHFEWFYKFPGGLPVNFNAGTTASIANVVDNSLHVIGYVNSTTGSPSIIYNARIRFQG